MLSYRGEYHFVLHRTLRSATTPISLRSRNISSQKHLSRPGWILEKIDSTSGTLFSWVGFGPSKTRRIGRLIELQNRASQLKLLLFVLSFTFRCQFDIFLPTIFRLSRSFWRKFSATLYRQGYNWVEIFFQTRILGFVLGTELQGFWRFDRQNFVDVRVLQISFEVTLDCWGI